MNTFIFFRTPGELVALLEWSLSVKGLAMRLEQQRLRKCSDGHAQWLEAQNINAQLMEHLSTK